MPDSGKLYFGGFDTAGKAQFVPLKYDVREEFLIDAVSEVRGPKVVVVEESHMAAWVKRVLEPYVEQIGDLRSAAPATRGSRKTSLNNDTTSAIKLAKLQLDGYIKGDRPSRGRRRETGGVCSFTTTISTSN